MFARALARWFACPLALVAVAVPGAAQAQDSITIVTRSTGTMQASGYAQDFVGLPAGAFRYELVATSTIYHPEPGWDLRSLHGWSDGKIELTANGATWTFRDPEGTSYTDAGYGSHVPYGGTTEYFEHSMYTSSYWGVGLSGYQRVEWPAGAYPGAQDFSNQSWSFDGAGSGEVFFKLIATGELLDGFEGTADHIEMSISAVPEPGQAALLLAGLGVMGWLGRRRYAASAGCSAFSMSARVKPWAKRSMKS